MALEKRIVRQTSVLGRKRIVVPTNPFCTPVLKRSRSIHLYVPKTIESLPHDLLVQVISKVTHEDLKQLLLVSKDIKEATSTARQLHFAYRTPEAKSRLRDVDDFGVEDEVDAPNAPMQHRAAKSRMNFDRHEDFIGRIDFDVV